ncbi:MAG: hypothetical protein JRJ03_18495 [Deltaproteobacteria bacterium]|nr:hypothetical protein [Deltaproteobacteria bacterium]
MTKEDRATGSILEKKDVLQWQVDSGAVRARKCKCGLVWCKSCSKGKWAKKHGEELASFDWRRTREVVVGIDRELFDDGQAAWRYVMDHKLIPGFIRNLKRGKKEKVGKEWVVKFEGLHDPRLGYFEKGKGGERMGGEISTGEDNEMEMVPRMAQGRVSSLAYIC